MSVEHMSIVINHSLLRGTQRTVLMILANHHGEHGAWPSIETLARGANCCERTVQRAITAAIEAGELEVILQDGGTHNTRADRRPNRYFLLLTCPPDCDGSPAHRSRRAATETTPRGDTSVTPQPVDNTPRGDTRDTPQEPRGDILSPRGDTGVTLTKEEPLLVTPVSPETTGRATTGLTDGPTPEQDEPAAVDVAVPATADPRLADPGFLRFLAAVAPNVRRPERFAWPPGELDALEARYRSPNPFGGHHAAPTPMPPRFDPATHGPPPDAVPMPDHIRDQLRRPA